MKNIRTQGMADLLGVTPQTIRKYTREGKIPFHTSPSGQLFFTEEDVSHILGENNSPVKDERKSVHYIRVSSGNKELMEAQKSKLIAAFGQPDITIEDKASGINERRKGLSRLLDMCANNEVSTVYVTRKDRLARLGYHYIEYILNTFNVTIVSLDAKDDEHTAEDELVDEIMTILSSYAGKINQQKSIRVRNKLKEKLDS